MFASIKSSKTLTLGDRQDTTVLIYPALNQCRARAAPKKVQIELWWPCLAPHPTP